MFLVGGYTVQAYYVIVSLGCLHCMVTLKRKNSEAPNCLRFIITGTVSFYLTVHLKSMMFSCFMLRGSDP